MPFRGVVPMALRLIILSKISRGLCCSDFGLLVLHSLCCIHYLYLAKPSHRYAKFSVHFFFINDKNCMAYYQVVLLALVMHWPEDKKEAMFLLMLF